MKCFTTFAMSAHETGSTRSHTVNINYIWCTLKELVEVTSQDYMVISSLVSGTNNFFPGSFVPGKLINIECGVVSAIKYD